MVRYFPSYGALHDFESTVTEAMAAQRHVPPPTSVGAATLDLIDLTNDDANMSGDYIPLASGDAEEEFDEEKDRSDADESDYDDDDEEANEDVVDEKKYVVKRGKPDRDPSSDPTSTRIICSSIINWQRRCFSKLIFLRSIILNNLFLLIWEMRILAISFSTF